MSADLVATIPPVAEGRDVALAGKFSAAIGHSSVRRERAKANRMNRVNGLGGNVRTMSQRFPGAMATASLDAAMGRPFGCGAMANPCPQWGRAAKP